MVEKPAAAVINATELQKRQEELEKKAAELQKREDELKNASTTAPNCILFHLFILISFFL